MRIEDIRTVKKLYEGSPGGVSPEGWPTGRCIDNVPSDCKLLMINISLAQE